MTVDTVHQIVHISGKRKASAVAVVLAFHIFSSPFFKKVFEFRKFLLKFFNFKNLVLPFEIYIILIIQHYLLNNSINFFFCNNNFSHMLFFSLSFRPTYFQMVALKTLRILIKNVL